MPSDALPLALDEVQDTDHRVALGSRAVLLRGLARSRAPELLAAIGAIDAVSPFRHLVTSGGWKMSVALTNCGRVGWVTDRTGYRYTTIDPATGRPWPEMPQEFADLATKAAGSADEIVRFFAATEGTSAQSAHGVIHLFIDAGSD
jgi:DNA oxidative demethylase